MKKHIVLLFILFAFLTACSGQPAGQDSDVAGETSDVVAEESAVESETDESSEVVDGQTASDDCAPGTR
ncbi:MAG: hypothetical protein AAGF95_34550, partial [Chloroflexota bacterium]